MGSMAQTGLLLVPSDALGHTWALPGALGGGQGLPPQTGPRNLLYKSDLLKNTTPVSPHLSTTTRAPSAKRETLGRRYPALSSLEHTPRADRHRQHTHHKTTTLHHRRPPGCEPGRLPMPRSARSHRLVDLLLHRLRALVGADGGLGDERAGPLLGCHLERRVAWDVERGAQARGGVRRGRGEQEGEYRGGRAGRLP